MSINLKWQSGYYGKAGRNLSGGNTARSVAQANAMLPEVRLVEEPAIHEDQMPEQPQEPGDGGIARH